MDTITVPAFTDAHVHLREGEVLDAVAPYTAACCARAVAMPNLSTPVHDSDVIDGVTGRYAEALGPDCAVHLTAKWLPRTTPSHIKEWKDRGIVGVKLYPAGVTTNSDDGIPFLNLRNMTKRVEEVLLAMEKYDLPLLCHGESDGFVLDREDEFMDVFLAIRRRFRHLRMTFEHVTTAKTIHEIQELTKSNYFAPTLATITLHHMRTTLDDVVGGSLNPHLFCKPIPKRRSDAVAVLSAARSGKKCFALGSDSAPHTRERKERCGCAGVFSAPVLAQGLAEEFFGETWWRGGYDVEESFVRFTSTNANDFYGFPPPTRTVTLEREPWFVPGHSDGIVWYKAGAKMFWALK